MLRPYILQIHQAGRWDSYVGTASPFFDTFEEAVAAIKELATNLGWRSMRSMRVIHRVGPEVVYTSDDDEELQDTLIRDLPGAPQQAYRGWVWYLDGGREPFKAPTRNRLIRDVLDAVRRLGVDGAFDDSD